MSHRSRIHAALPLATAACAALSVSICLGQSGGTRLTPAASPAPSVATLSLENRINKLEQENAELEKKIQKPPKDNWDKLGTLSGFVTGILVAAIGALVTVVY